MQGWQHLCITMCPVNDQLHALGTWHSPLAMQALSLMGAGTGTGCDCV